MNQGAMGLFGAVGGLTALLNTINHNLMAADGQAQVPKPTGAMGGQIGSINPWQLLHSLMEERTKNVLLASMLMANPQSVITAPLKQETTPQSTGENPSILVPLEKPLSESSSSESSQESEYLSQDDHPRNLRGQRKKARKLIGRGIHKNQTKNIPKNFGKAIANFIEKNEQLTLKILERYPGIDYAHFILDIRQRRKCFSSIADLRSLWLDTENKFAAPARTLSLVFLRKHSLPYIFHSRVTNFEGHVKYRLRLMQAIRNPQSFTHIKEY